MTWLLDLGWVDEDVWRRSLDSWIANGSIRCWLVWPVFRIWIELLIVLAIIWSRRRVWIVRLAETVSLLVVSLVVRSRRSCTLRSSIGVGVEESRVRGVIRASVEVSSSSSVVWDRSHRSCSWAVVSILRSIGWLPGWSRDIWQLGVRYSRSIFVDELWLFYLGSLLRSAFRAMEGSASWARRSIPDGVTWVEGTMIGIMAWAFAKIACSFTEHVGCDLWNIKSRSTSAVFSRSWTVVAVSLVRATPLFVGLRTTWLRSRTSWSSWSARSLRSSSSSSAVISFFGMWRWVWWVTIFSIGRCFQDRFKLCFGNC